MVTKDGDHSEGGEENIAEATLDKLLKKVSDLSAKAIEGFKGHVGGKSGESSTEIETSNAEAGENSGSRHEKLVAEGGVQLGTGLEEAVVDNVEGGVQLGTGLEEDEVVPGNVEGYVELFDNGPGLSDISGGESSGIRSIHGSSDEDEDYVEESSESDCDESVDEESREIGGDNSDVEGDNSDEEGDEVDDAEVDDVIIPAEIRGEGIEHNMEGNAVVFEVGMSFLDKAN